MESTCKERSLLYLLLFAICAASVCFCARRSNVRRSDRLSPPLDIQLETFNCTAFSVRWKMPRRHVSTITGYKAISQKRKGEEALLMADVKAPEDGRGYVQMSQIHWHFLKMVYVIVVIEDQPAVDYGLEVFYTELKNGRPLGTASLMEVPLSLDMLTTDVEVGNLRVNTKYRVSVGAYGWAGEGRASMPRDVSTASHEMCMPPSPPTQPVVMAVSDTELALSWQQGESEGSAPVLHFLVAYIRPEMDTEWTYIREPIETNSMVLKGLIPETEYQFVVRAVNVHGVSPPSHINNPVRTLGASEVGSGDYGSYITDLGSKDEDGFDVDDSDYDIYIEELKPFPGINQDNRKSQLRSRFGPPSGQNVVYRMNTVAPPPNFTAPPASSTTSSIFQVFTDLVFSTTSEPSTTRGATTTASPTTTSTTLPTTTPTPTMSSWKGEVPRVYDLTCDDTVCPPDSFCLSDYDNGGSRCHCNLGRSGDTCSEVVSVNFPRFYGYSHMTFEPLKNSYQTFQITLEFKADSEDGLLLYCGENEHGRGDFTSLALVRGKLHYRFNCGTGVAQIISESRIVVGQWHTVTAFRDGMSGWLRMDNDTPISGRSQGQYTKITFRSPLYVGGSPSAYWLVRATGTNRGFVGCIQSLTINNKATDIRPWPLGRALNGADIGFSLSSPLFNETVFSYAVLPWPQTSQSYLSFMEFELTFRPSTANGMLLYSDDADSGDFLAINLVDRYVEFRFDCGSGGAVIRSEEQISLDGWHELRVSRTAKSGILQVDSQRPQEAIAEGAFTQISCSSPLYIGGVPEYDKTKRTAGVIKPFTGTIQKFILNDRTIPITTGSAGGVNVANSAHPCVESPCANGGTCRPKWDGYECDCPLGVSGSRNNLFMRFKSTAKDGLLLWRGDSPMRPNSDFLSMGLQDGALIFSYNLGSGAANIVVNGSFSDGKWHRVKAVRDGQSGKLTVDDYGAKTGRSPGKMRQLNINGPLYVGGMKEIALHTNRQYVGGLLGCVSHFTLSTDYHLALVEDAADGKNINTCSN
ncbi:hypothetical protein PAMP_022707 [Pampus punctatissimus]